MEHHIRTRSAARSIPRAGTVAILVALTLALTGCLDAFRSLSGSSRSDSAPSSGSESLASPGGSVAATPIDTRAMPTAKEASRFLHQATFGVTSEDVTALSASNLDTWLEQQFAKPHPSVVDYLRAAAATGPKDLDVRGLFYATLWERKVRGEDQLRQRIAFALSEIFVVSGANDQLIGQPYTLASYYDMLGRNAFGNYRRLLEEVALHPAMGQYLSALANTKEDPATGKLPDENFAREIMQLFSVGLVQLNRDGTPKRDALRKTSPTYDQDAILGMAKVFTGWSWGGPDKSEYRFKYGQYDWLDQYQMPMQSYPQFHSTSAKKIIDGYVIPAGGTPESDLAAALDRLAAHPNVGPFLSLRLIQRLVTSNPSPAYVERVAARFDNNGSGARGDLKAVIRAVLVDPEARTAAAAASVSFGKLREPVQRLTNLARLTYATAPDGSFVLGNLASTEWSLGQNALYAPSVFNWFRPDFAPAGMIADQGLLAPEFQILNEYTAVSVTGMFYWILENGFVPPHGPQPILTRWTAMAGRPEAMVDDLDLLLCAGTMSGETRDAIVTAVRDTPTTLNRWQFERARTAIYLVLASPDYLVQK